MANRQLIGMKSLIRAEKDIWRVAIHRICDGRLALRTKQNGVLIKLPTGVGGNDALVHWPLVVNVGLAKRQNDLGLLAMVAGRIQIDRLAAWPADIVAS